MTRRPDQPEPRPAGFTLIEVLVVVVVLGIAAAIVTPALLRPGTLTVQGAARLLVADLLHAQNEAVGRQVERRVVFDVENNRYRLTEADGTLLSDPLIGLYEIDFDNDRRFRGVRIEAVNLAGDDTHIAFDDLGTPSTGGHVDLVASGHRYRVSITEFTGRVSVAPVP